jgi:hypothetical protein
MHSMEKVEATSICIYLDCMDFSDYHISKVRISLSVVESLGAGLGPKGYEGKKH